MATRGFRSLFSWIPLCRAAWSSISRASRRCFDPCSPGYRSAGAVPGRPCSWGTRVSILVLLDTALPGVEVIRAEIRDEFRSLFSWIPLCRDPLSSLLAGGINVFRSLFSWIPLCRGTSWPSASRVADGFDPCSPGYRSAGRPGAEGQFIAGEFRSLFSWIPLCRYTAKQAVQAVVTFRSLFSWIPLCRCSPPPSAISRSRVSILVLLDTALPAFRSGIVPAAREVSILVLLDTALPDQ